jgi:taurine dioxygenase
MENSMHELATQKSFAAQHCGDLAVTPISPAIGVEVAGVELGPQLSDETVAELRGLLLKHKLLIFRDQEITSAQHVGFARRFGELELHPVFPHDPDFPELVLLGGDNSSPGRENLYHSDVSWRDRPSLGSILRCVQCPPVGGDTIWVNMAVAYECLPASVKTAVQSLQAVHDVFPGFADRLSSEKKTEMRAEFPPQYHPVVRTHPETGEKILYVNAWTTHLANYIECSLFRNMTELHGGAMSLLQYLIDQAKIPEYQVRVRWRPNTIAFWDNRATQHYAVQDYFPAVRRMMRATIIGDKPY